VSLYGMLLNRDADFSIVPGSGVLSLGAGGLGAGIPGEIPHTYTVSAALTLAAPQTWSVTNTGTALTTVIVSGPITDNGSNHALTKAGNGILALSGDSSAYGGAITVLTGSVLRVGHALGLGNAAGITAVQNGGRLEVGGGVTVSEPLQLNGDAAGIKGALYSVSGTNTWTGTITQSSRSRIGATEGSTLILSGLISGSGIYLSPAAASCVALAGQPLKMGSNRVYAHGSGTVAIGVTGNTWDTLEVSGLTVRTDVPNALPATASLSLGSGYNLNATVDLNGNSQTVGQLMRGLTTPGIRCVTSGRPATLTVNMSSASECFYDGDFSGEVSLVKTGGGTLYLMGTNSTYSGATTINGGTLRVETRTSLGNSTRVTVTGGTLRLRNGTSLSDAANLSIANGGAKVSVDAGVVETVRTLRLGGLLMRRGTYGATASGADTIDNAHFSGTGKINVLRGAESFITLR
jgi:autotransporter-associated beta strand protein